MLVFFEFDVKFTQMAFGVCERGFSHLGISVLAFLSRERWSERDEPLEWFSKGAHFCRPPHLSFCLRRGGVWLMSPWHVLRGCSFLLTSTPVLLSKERWSLLDEALACYARVLI